MATTTTTAQTVAINSDKAPITTNFGDAELPSSEEVNKVYTKNFDEVINERQIKLASLLGTFINKDKYKAYINAATDPKNPAEACIEKDTIAYDTLTPTQRVILKNYLTLVKVQRDSESTTLTDKTAAQAAMYKLKYLHGAYHTENTVSLAIAMAKIRSKIDADKAVLKDLGSIDEECKPFTL